MEGMASCILVVVDSSSHMVAHHIRVVGFGGETCTGHVVMVDVVTDMDLGAAEPDTG